MKPPPSVQLRAEENLLIWRPRGVLNESIVNEIIRFIADEEAKSDATGRRFVDARGLTAVELNFRYVFHVALYRRLSREGKPPIKSAFLVSEPAFQHYFKLHSLLTDHSSLQVRLFSSEQGAVEWLKVPLESLGNVSSPE